MEVIANNLANSDTLAFKKDQAAFKEYLSTLERNPGPAPLPHGPVKDKDFYPLDGRDQAFVIVDGTHTSFKQGHLRVTQSPLDVALEGSGFIEVSTPNGVRYTRQGSLKIAMDGRLVTSDGNPVLASQPGGLAAQPAASVQPGQGGLATQGGVAAGSEAARFINLRERGSNLTINRAGEIYAGDELVAKLSVVEFPDLGKIRKSGGSLFENKDPANRPAAAAATVVHQGVLEGSNVNPIEEMTNLIRANRLFEQDLKAMKTYGELMGREANDIGKL